MESKRLEIGGTVVSVEYTGRRDSDSRQIWRWEVVVGGSLYSAADLKSGCYASPDANEMLATLLSFIGDFAESVQHGDGENMNLFPAGMGEWAVANSDEIACAACELEEAS